MNQVTENSDTTQEIQRIYLRCLQCKSNISIHDQSSQKISVYETQKGQSQIIMVNGYQGPQKAQSRKIVPINYEIKCLKLMIERNETILICIGCESRIGQIFHNKIGMYQEAIEQTSIKYKIGTKGSSNKQKRSKQALYNKLRAYTSALQETHNRKLDNLKLENIEKLNTQLKSFISFYRQWQNKKENVSEFDTSFESRKIGLHNHRHTNNHR